MSKYLIILLIFSQIISFSLTFPERTLTYKEFINQEFEESTVNEGISYIISYEKGDINNNYIRIWIKPDEENKSIYAYYSPISQNRKDAYLLNSGNNEIYLYINKAFTKLEANGVIYLTIACFDSQCPFTLTTLETEYIDLGRHSQYSYFTTDKKNLVNTFMVYGKEAGDNEDYITFWASGNKNIQMNINYVTDKGETQIESNSFINGKYALIKETNTNSKNNKNALSHYIIEVTAPANNLITFGNNVNLNNNLEIKSNTYTINTNEIYGSLSEEAKMQCFDFNIGNQYDSYLNILDFNKNLELKIIDKQGKEVSKQVIENGNILFTITQSFKDDIFCLSREDYASSEYSVFSLQVTYDIENNYFKNIYSPQINGFFYERYLEKGQIAFFMGLPSINFKTEIRYYLKKNSGYPEMYFVKCTTFPNCKFNINSLPSDTIKPKRINDMFSYSIFKTETMKLVSPEQYILLVHCNGDFSCSFQTNFYSELDKIVMQKDKRTYHTIMSQGENNFAIKLQGEENYNQIFVNFLTYSGDISIKVEAEGFRTRDFVAGNKKYFVLDFGTGKNIKETLDNEIYFYIKGELPSFYSADYKFIYSDADKIRMYEESGINYLETIEPKVGYKTIVLANKRLIEKKDFTVNFFSLNCEIDITRKISIDTKTLETFDFLSQDVILNTDPIYNNQYYNYLMKIKKMDNVTEFDTNWCMVYVSSIEQNSDNDEEYQKRNLLISEGVINRVMLNQEMPKIEYIYPHINPKGYVVMYLNWQTGSKITVTINIENSEYKTITISKSQYIIIPENEIRLKKYCPYLATKPNQVCSIVVQIKLDSNFYNDEPILEFSIKSQEIVPAFIRKSMLRKDIVVGNYFQYFYTEVGIKEEGHINIKFDRGSGKVYGRIVEKDKNEGSGWMNRIILPDENNNELTYNYYTKKIYYGEQETQKCEVGCYLLIKVEPNFSDYYYLNDNIAYPISLSINANNAAIPLLTQDMLNVVDIPLNEYIVGDTVPLSGRFGYFYSLFIPYDCQLIIIEFLCESSYIYVNVGNKKPTLNTADFSYKVMNQDGILKITKEQILNKIPSLKNSNSIKNVQLTIAIGAQYFDDESSSVYSFRIRALRENEIELITLTSDQKTLCNIEGKKGNCYFIVPYGKKFDEQNNIFFHAIYLPNVDFNYYASEIPKEKIDNRDQTEIKNLLPSTFNKKWSNNNSKGNYLYIDYNEITDKQNSYIILNLEVNCPYKNDNENTVVTLLHTLYSYKGSVLPNPSSAQLFLVNNNNLNNLYFTFSQTTKNLLIRIKSVSGSGKIYWDMSDDVQIFGNKENIKLNSEDENVYYYLNTPGETITLTLGKGEKFPLHFTNSDINKDKKDSNESPGFGFYTTYERAPQQENYNNLEYSANSLYNFKDTDFPFIFYSKLQNTDNEIDVNIQLFSLTKKFSSSSKINIQSSETETEIPSYDEFSISGIIEDENFIYSKHIMPEIHPDESKMFKGEYDPINKLLKIQFTPEIIKGYNVPGNNYLYVQIDKNKQSNVEYTESSMEINIFPSNNDGFVADMDKYIYGKIPYGQKGYIRYELNRINSLFNFMRIEFSANYDKINFAINSFKLGDDISKIDFYKSNIEFSKENYNGKTVIIIEFKDPEIKNIFLSIFNTDNSNYINNQKQLSNFIFKYQIKEQNNFIKLKPKEESLQVSYDKNTLDITLPTFDSLPSDYTANYVVKLIPSENKIENENYNSLSSIESNITKLYKKTQTDFSSIDRIQILDLLKDKVYYVLINCEIVSNNYNELFSFKYIDDPTSINKEKDKNNTVIIALIFLASGIVVIAIIFVVIFFYLKKANLKRTIQLEELTRQINSSSSAEVPTF